jgi:tryptophan-rich sensory protein
MRSNASAHLKGTEETMRTSTQIFGLIVFLLVCYAAAFIGSQFTTPATQSDWYAQLYRPPWSPPNWVFGPVWTLLYTLMAIAAWLVWRKRAVHGASIPLLLFGVQLALNVLWSVIFFGLRLPALAAGEIVLLWLAILATLIAFWRVTPVAGWLLVPYLLWVTYAMTLNFAIAAALQ